VHIPWLQELSANPVLYRATAKVLLVDSPFQQRRERWRSSSSRASLSLSPSRTLERRVSGPHPSYSPSQDRNRLTSPLSHSHIPCFSSSPSSTRVHELDEERGVFGLSSIHPPPMSYSPTSTLSDSVITTPCIPRFPNSKPNLRIIPALELSRSQWSSNHPRQCQLLVPNRLPDHPHHPTIQISPYKVLLARKYTSNAPAPLKLGPRSEEVFLRIKYFHLSESKSGYPTSPPTGTSQILALFPLLQRRRHLRPPLHEIHLL
jgi:hypothetical protein